MESKIMRYKCNGVAFDVNGRGVVECNLRKSCKRYLPSDCKNAQYAQYLIPEMTVEKPYCEEYINET